MSPEEYVQLLNYISENNGWGNNMYETCCERRRHAIKYVDAVFDTRDSKVWHIVFRGLVDGSRKEFRVETAEDLKKVYEYLDEEVK